MFLKNSMEMVKLLFVVLVYSPDNIANYLQG